MEIPELWLVQCVDCDRDPGELTEPKAELILHMHQHDPETLCTPRSVARDFLDRAERRPTLDPRTALRQL
jgi:hypothetical protein